jgi:hypothetical protein
LPIGNLKLLSVIGSVPTTATLGDAGMVVLESVRINGQASEMAGDAALDIVAYAGDMDFDGAYTASDVTLVGRVGTGLVTSLSKNDDVDVAVLADIDSNGNVNALDTAAVLARTKAASTAAIAVIPPVVVPPPGTITLVPKSLIAASPDTPPTVAPVVNLLGTFSNFDVAGGGSGSGSGGGISAPSGSTPVVPPSTLRILPSTLSTGASA